jgi:protein-tyrosine sulfotransferase
MTGPGSNQPYYLELIVLCGPPRSGTTWLSRELCSAPTAFPFLPECTFLTQQIELYHRTRHYSDRRRVEAYFANEKNMLDYFRANVATLIDQAARLNPKVDARTLVLKDPGMCLYLVDLKDLLPSHKLVVLVRDPRDVLASMKNVMAKKQQKWDISAATEELLNYYYQIGHHRQRVEKNCIFVRYEDLVAGQSAVLQDFLKLPLATVASSGDGITNVRERLDSSDPFFSELYLQPTTAAKVGSYVKILTSNEIRHIETVCAAIIRQWDYPLAPSVRSFISSLIRNRQPVKVPE